METLISILAVLAGFLIRLAIPIGLTAVLILFLHKLDSHWQSEAELPVLARPKIQCWRIKDCPPEQIARCAAAHSPQPCWQVFRLPNGYLREECLTCEVFIKAPLPTLKTEPRRM